MSNSTPHATREAPLELLVLRIVQGYVRAKTEERAGMTWDDFKGKKVTGDDGRERVDIPREYREAKEHVASSIFLEMRSRRDQDFVNHFVATFGSVRQYLPEPDYLVVTQALLDRDRREDVKTLTLLALSANS